MTGRVIYLAILFILCFLYTLNLYLRGRLRQIIEGVFALLLILSIGASFFVFNSKFGLLVLFLVFLFIGVARPLASFLAKHMLGYRTGVAGDHGGNNLHKMFEGKMSMDEYFEASRREEEKRSEKFEALLRRPRFAEFVGKYRLTPKDLENHYSYLGVCGLQDLAWEILENPADLEKLILMREEHKTPPEIYTELSG